MSKTWEHYDLAARHHERAAHEFKGAAKYHETEEHEKAAHHAYLAHGHNQHTDRDMRYQSATEMRVDLKR